MKNSPACLSLIVSSLALVSVLSVVEAQSQVGRFALFEETFRFSGQYRNPYTDIEAIAEVNLPNGDTQSVPLFWDGGSIFKLRISPDRIGEWTYRIHSKDKGLNGKRGSLRCTPSSLPGSIEPMKGYPHHLQRQDGVPFLLWGDTAWGLYLDQDDEKLNRESAFRYIDKRASEGVNVMHSMLLSEAGWGNSGGPPFEDIGEETLNPDYWREVDVRLRYLNDKGIVGGLVVAWGNKGRDEPYSWGRFPSVEARKRFARYIGARYSAFDVYFIVSGEWNAEIKNRENESEESVRAEFAEIGSVLEAADPHSRMKGMHPMTAAGTVSEFNTNQWMSFGDYQQNYQDLHDRILQCRVINKPIVNSEYGYYLRDTNSDGKVDKHNSFTSDDMRFATWDIVMAGGYPITGYGSTYMGGFRDPGPFNPDDPRNNVWAAQYQLAQHFLHSLEWWKLEPHDAWISATQARTEDRSEQAQMSPNSVRKVLRPPLRTYWLLADPGRQYVAYGRGLTDPVAIRLGGGERGNYSGTYFDPETGIRETLGALELTSDVVNWTPPSKEDWVLLISRID